MPWPRYLPYIPRSQCWCKQWRHRWFGTPLRTLWRHCIDFKDTEYVPFACVDSLPSNCTDHFRQQWLRHWLDAYAPSHCLNQWWFEIIDIHHLCEHEFHVGHPIALPFRAGCGVRIMKSVSKCDAFLSLYWRVKGGPRLVDMPGARWPATHGCHSGITSWSSWPGLRTSPIIYFCYSAILHDAAIKWKHFSALVTLCEGSTGHRLISLTVVSDTELWPSLCLWMFWPHNGNQGRQMEIKEKDTYILKGLYSFQNKENFCQAMSNISWDEISRSRDTQQAFDTFHKHLVEIYNKHFPKIRIKRKYNNRKPWLSEGLKNSIKQKNKLYLKLTKITSALNAELYKSYKRKITAAYYSGWKTSLPWSAY